VRLPPRKVSAYAAMASLGVSVPSITQDAAFGFTNGMFGFNLNGPAGPTRLLITAQTCRPGFHCKQICWATVHFISPTRSRTPPSNVSTASGCCR